MIDHISENQDGSLRVDFSDRPLIIDGVSVNEVTMREPCVSDQLISVESAGSDAAREVHLIASLTELPPQTVKSFKMRQYQRLQGAYASFLD